jgi:hypothetical protein
MGKYLVGIMGYKTTPGLLHNLQILVVIYVGVSNAFCEQYTKSKKFEENNLFFFFFHLK